MEILAIFQVLQNQRASRTILWRRVPKRCPNCSTRETDTHLMRYPNDDKTHLFIDTVEDLEKWMETNGKTDSKLLYWVTKYLLMFNDKPFSQLGFMSEKMCTLAESQDKIG
jgi:hypothetical protein